MKKKYIKEHISLLNFLVKLYLIGLKANVFRIIFIK